MTEAVSICIPTFNRPDLIRFAVESCFTQTTRPMEILIGDDSADDRTREAVAALARPDGVTIRYERNAATLGQSRNVNGLFRRARGRHILLLHDDDVLSPNGLDRLRTALSEVPGRLCAYGLQQVLDADGTPLDQPTLRWNERDHRVATHAGPQSSPLRAALWQHVPNDGYLMDAALARRVGYPDESAVGHAVDARFIIDFAKQAPADSFFFLPAFVSGYRLTPNSIARSQTINRRQDLFFASLLADPSLRAESDALDGLLQRIAEGAALDAAFAGERLAALRILFSEHYDRPFLSRWTLYRLVCTASTSTGTVLKRFLSAS